MCAVCATGDVAADSRGPGRLRGVNERPQGLHEVALPAQQLARDPGCRGSSFVAGSKGAENAALKVSLYFAAVHTNWYVRGST